MALEKLGVRAVVEGLNSFVRDMKKMSGSVDDSASTQKKSFESLEKTIKNTRDGYLDFKTKVMDAIGTVRKIFDFAQEGAQLLRLEQAGESLARSFGISMDDIVDAVDKAAEGTVARADIIQAANRAMLLGVADSAEKMAQLMEVAAVRGKAMGLSTTQAFNDIVTGIGRASPMILDNLGIVTGGEAVYDRFALSIGKTKDQLTDAEKKTALFNAVLESTAPLLEDAAKGGEDIATEFERALATIANFTNELKKFAAIGVGRAITAIETLLTMDARIAQALKGTYKELIKTTDNYEDYESAILGIADSTNRMTMSQAEYNERLEKGGISARIAEKSVVLLTEAEWKRERQLEKVDEIMKASAEDAREYAEFIDGIRNTTVALIEEEANLEEQQARIDEDFRNLKDLMKVDLTESFVEFQSKVQDLTGEISELEGMDYLTDDQKKQLEESRDELDKTIKKWREYTSQIIFNIAAQALEREGLTEEEAIALAKSAEGLGLVDDGYAALTESIYKSADSMEFTGDQSDAFAEAMIRLIDALGDTTIQAEELDEAIRRIPTTKQITVSYDYAQFFRQHGGDVQRGLPYLVGEGGKPEIFVPDVSGHIYSNAMSKAMGLINPTTNNTQTNYGDNLNLNIYTSAPYEDIISDFRMMKAMGGRV